MAARYRTGKIARHPGVYQVVRVADGAVVGHKVYYRDASGKQHTKSFTGRNTLTTAAKFKAQVVTRKDEGTLLDASRGKIRLAEFVEHFLRTETHLKPSTRSLYEMHARLYIAGGSLGARALNTVGVEDVKRLLGEMQDAGKGAATIGAVKRLLHRVFAVAVQERRIASNPVTGIRLEKPKEREPRFLTKAEVRAIADEVPARYRALVWTLSVAGLRIGEASALRVRNLNGVIRVAENSPEVNGKKHTGTTKTGKARTVDIPPALRAMMRDHVSTYGNVFDPESLIFTATEGGPVRQNYFRRFVFHPAVERAGIKAPRPTVHDLRHTAASFMADAGLTLLEAAQQLGHSATAMTERYSHVFPDARQAKVDRLDSVFEGMG